MLVNPCASSDVRGILSKGISEIIQNCHEEAQCPSPFIALGSEKLALFWVLEGHSQASRDMVPLGKLT